MADPAPPPGLTAAEMSDRCYAEGRALMAEGHKALADTLMAAGGFWWAVARKGRAAALARLSGQPVRQEVARRPIGFGLLGAAGEAWAAGLVTEAEAAVAVMRQAVIPGGHAPGEQQQDGESGAHGAILPPPAAPAQGPG